MGRAADALRKAGYRRIPQWFATDEQIELIEYMVKQNGPEVNRIRREALGVDETNAAWRQHEESKK